MAIFIYSVAPSRASTGEFVIVDWITLIVSQKIWCLLIQLDSQFSGPNYHYPSLKLIAA